VTTPQDDAAEGLRERYAEAAARWALMYPISSWALREGEAAEKLAKVWGEQIARFLDEEVRDLELEQLRAANERMTALVGKWSRSADNQLAANEDETNKRLHTIRSTRVHQLDLCVRDLRAALDVPVTPGDTEEVTDE
jgi:hypothetical protein